MPAFDPRHLAQACGGAWNEIPAAALTGFSIDSRTIRPGEVFVALQTDRRDGHDFLGDAAAGGAGAALVSRRVPGIPVPQLVVADTLAALHALARDHRRRFRGRVVAVTGSAGKTSTKDLLAVLLGDADRVLATEGNLNNHLGVPLTLLRIDHARHAFAVVEAGISGPGEMDVIAGLIEPDVAVITTVAPAHLERLSTVEGVAAEKARIAAHLAAGGVAVFPASCLEHRAFRDLAVPVLLALRPGLPAPALRPGSRTIAYSVRHHRGLTGLSVTWNGGSDEFEFRRVTTGMAANGALAVIAARHLGVACGEMRARLPRWRPATLRGEVRRYGDRTFYLDCYNANPASMEDALEGFLAAAPVGMPRLFVVGCMEELGVDAASMHRRLGERWPWTAGDRMLVLGAHATDLATGVRTFEPAADILVNPAHGLAAEIVAAFPGAVFVKGSRSHALESLLPPDGGHGFEVGHGKGEAA